MTLTKRCSSLATSASAALRSVRASACSGLAQRVFVMIALLQSAHHCGPHDVELSHLVYLRAAVDGSFAFASRLAKCGHRIP